MTEELHVCISTAVEVQQTTLGGRSTMKTLEERTWYRGCRVKGPGMGDPCNFGTSLIGRSKAFQIGVRALRQPPSGEKFCILTIIQHNSKQSSQQYLSSASLLAVLTQCVNLARPTQFTSFEVLMTTLLDGLP